MPIITCPKCSKRYDPGIDESLEEMPGSMSLKVVCPACGQWLRYPEREAIPAPNAPPEILREMRKQSRLVDEDGPRRARPARRRDDDDDEDDDRPVRRSRREDDDDEDDDRPRRRSRREDDEDEDDDRPRRRSKPAKKSNAALIIGLAVGGVLLLACIGGGVAFFALKGSGFGSVATITDATRQPDRVMGGTQYVQVNYTCSAAPPTGYEVVAVASAGGATSWSRPVPMRPGSTGHVGWNTAELLGARGTVQVWFEQRPIGERGSGRKVSNSYTIN